MVGLAQGRSRGRLTPGGAAWLVLLLPLCLGAAGVCPRPLAADGQEASPVAVPYLTNRTVAGEGENGAIYAAGRGTPRFGRCEVQFTPIPVVAELAASVPFYLPAETKRLHIEERADEPGFWDELMAMAAKTRTGSVVLFIHGYSNEFERACRMAAELQRLLDGEAVVLLFSWPSSARPLEYARDQAAVEWSVPWLAETLDRLGQRLGAERLQVLAHSLGSRGIVFALHWLAAGRGAARLIGELVLLAPDFDAQAFAAHVPRLRPLVRAITVYASQDDAPLRVSQQLHGLPRLGQGGELRTLLAGVETVDVTPAMRYQVLGHEYFYRHRGVAADLQRLLVTGERAAERPGLRAGVEDGLPYWELLEAPAEPSLPASPRGER